MTEAHNELKKTSALAVITSVPWSEKPCSTVTISGTAMLEQASATTRLRRKKRGMLRAMAKRRAP